MSIFSGYLRQENKNRLLIDVCLNCSSKYKELYKFMGIAFPKSFFGKAIIDTGASMSCIDSKIITEFGAHLRDRRETVSIGGKKIQNIYSADLKIPNLSYSWEEKSFVSVDLSELGVSAVLGRDILSKMLLIYDGTGERFSLAT